MSNSDGQIIFDQTETTNQIMIVNTLQNWSFRYFSHYNIIKFVSFKPNYYIINLSVVSSTMVLSNLIYVFLMCCQFESIKLFTFQKKK